MKVLYNFLGFKKNLSGTGVFALTQIICLSDNKTPLIILVEECQRARIKEISLDNSVMVIYHRTSSNKYVRLLKAHLYPFYYTIKYRPKYYISPLAIPVYLCLSPRTIQIITIHDIISKVGSRKYSKLRSNIINLSFYLAIKQASKILVLSPNTKSDVLANFRVDDSLFTLVHNVAYNSNEHRIDLHSVDDVFLVVGNVQRGKNPEGIIKAFIRLKQSGRFEKTLLIFVGSIAIDYRTVLEELAFGYLGESIYFKGYVEEVDSWYRKARVVIFASFYEGFGIPILEAYSYEKPLVLSNLSSMPYVGGNGAYYCDPYKIESIAGAMHKAYNREDWVSRKVAMREQLIKFSRASLKDIYKELTV